MGDRAIETTVDEELRGNAWRLPLAVRHSRLEAI